ncbi:MAG: hypothetical protein FRX49_08635 [Trebouxia sp. A1-2]|nr:MAG: hypothetical protein FRX49_08635 [Trebouxia sp. A1-2]
MTDLRGELRVSGELLQLLEQGIVELVLVKLEQLLHEAGITQLFLGLVPATATGVHAKELHRPGNILQRSLKASPMGLRHRMTCKLVRTRSRKKAYRASPVSPAPSFLAAGLTSSSTPASSSLGNKLGTSPGLEILPELSDAVALADLNAEALLVCYVGRQATDTLAATAPHPHQQGIAAGLHQDPVDAADMQNGIPAAIVLRRRPGHMQLLVAVIGSDLEGSEICDRLIRWIVCGAHEGHKGRAVFALAKEVIPGGAKDGLQLVIQLPLQPGVGSSSLATARIARQIWSGNLQALAEGIAASTRRCHGSHELHVLDLLGLAPLPVIPEAVVHPQLQQLKGWDEAKLALLRHVEVINEGYQVLASRPSNTLEAIMVLPTPTPPTSRVCTPTRTRLEAMNLTLTVSTVGTMTLKKGISAGGLQQPTACQQQKHRAAPAKGQG